MSGRKYSRKRGRRRQGLWLRRLKVWALVVLVLGVVAVASVDVWMEGVRMVYGWFAPELNTTSGQENYSVVFRDLQDRQMRAARRFGISEPLASRDVAAEAVDALGLRRIEDNRVLKVARLTHSVPYLTDGAADVLQLIGESFRDSLRSKGLPRHRIVVTSVLRTQEDVVSLRRVNSNASANSTHCFGTTFDISYVTFDPVGLTLRTDRGLLKKALAEVLRDLRDEGKCFVRYEKAQTVFHITARQ